MSGVTITIPCEQLWDGSCSAWGATGPHGCKLTPGHDGDCQCACNRHRNGTPFTPWPEEAADG